MAQAWLGNARGRVSKSLLEKQAWKKIMMEKKMEGRGLEMEEKDEASH